MAHIFQNNHPDKLTRMRRHYVDSSMATSVGYDKKTRTLEIEFRSNGDIWQYLHVPESEYLQMIGGSIGQYFQAHIKGQYPERQVQ